MKTNFFQLIDRFKSTGSWTIHIAPTAEDGKMIVSVLLTETTTAHEGFQLTPMIFNEDPKILDDTLLARIAEPVQQINELFVNAAQVNQSIDNARNALEDKALKNAKPSSPKADDGAEKKQRYDEAIKKIAELISICKYDDAEALLPSVEDYPDKQADIEKIQKDLVIKKNQLSLL